MSAKKNLSILTNYLSDSHITADTLANESAKYGFGPRESVICHEQCDRQLIRI